MESQRRAKKSKSQLGWQGEPTAGKDGGQAAASQVAFRLLAVRGRSVAELRERLLTKGFAVELVERVLADLLRRGLLDDELFATLRAESIVRRKPVGRDVLSAALLRHKLASPLIAAVVETLLPYERECALARLVLESAWARIVRSRPRAGDHRALLMRTLRQRGFSREVMGQMVELDIPKLLGNSADTVEEESP